MTRVNTFLLRYAPWAWALLLVMPLWWASDREPPFRIVKYIEPEPVRAGQQVVFAMPVERDLERGCDVTFTRHLYDGANVRHDYVRHDKGEQVNHKPGLDPRIQIMSAEGIAAMDKNMGPWLRVAVTVPVGATPGRASLGTELEYRCNPIHARWPIRVSLSYPFEILP